MSITIDVKRQKQVDRFKQALHESKGKTNNSFAWNLIQNSDATTEDVVRLGTREGNSGYYNDCILHKGLWYDKGIDAILKKNKQKRENARRLTDYKWFFPNAKVDDIDGGVKLAKNYDTVTDVVETAMRSILNTTKEMDYEGRRILAYKILTDIVYGSDYFHKKFVERIDNKNLGDWHITMRNNIMKLSLENNRDSLNFIYSGYNLYKCSRKNIKQILELCDKITYSELIMNSYTSLDENGNNLSRIYTRKHIQDWGSTSKVDAWTLELMKVNGTYKMLLDMGIAWTKTGWTTPNRREMARVHTRTRSMYKTFMKSKTVEQREATRSLLIEQLNLIAHDFGNNRYEFKQMDCYVWQDKEFKDNINKKDKKETKNVKGLPKGTKIDITELELD